MLYMLLLYQVVCKCKSVCYTTQYIAVIHNKANKDTLCTRGYLRHCNQPLNISFQVCASGKYTDSIIYHI